MNRPVQVVVGKLVDPENIENFEARTVQDPRGFTAGHWDKRAMWSWLRLNYGRKTIDPVITETLTTAEEAVREKHGYLESKWRYIPDFVRQEITLERSRALEGLFKIRVLSKEVYDQRKLQYILEGQTVMAVASLDHLLIPPEEVYAVGKQIFAASGIQLKVPEHGIHGLVGFIKEVQGLKFGLQFFGGNILTRQAIKVGCFVKVLMCTNPISWMGVSGFMGWITKPDNYERVLRIKVRTELEPRITQAISGAQQQLADLEGRIEHTKEVPLSSDAAKALTAAMGMSYGLGAKTIEQVLEGFEGETQTQWGLSMAMSYVAAHGEFRAAPEGSVDYRNQKLSTISGVLLTIDDIKAAEQKSLGWLKEHIESGRLKTIEDILKDLDIK